MRFVLIALAALIGGYIAGALLGAAMIELFSGNRHDRSVEAAMTGAFVTGPLGALVSLIAAFLWRR